MPVLVDTNVIIDVLTGFPSVALICPQQPDRTR